MNGVQSRRRPLLIRPRAKSGSWECRLLRNRGREQTEGQDFRNASSVAVAGPSTQLLGASAPPTVAPLASGSRADRRMLQLDILRGVAILLILFRHPVMLPQEAGFLAPIATAIHRFGWTGVDLFFVLSGFLIG